MNQEKTAHLPAMTVEADSLGRVRCPGCGISFELRDRNRWTGVRHRTCGRRLTITNVEKQLEPVWCVVGNIAERESSLEDDLQRGAKHFSPGTKVYCHPPLWSDAYEKVQVVGLHRGSRQFVEMVIASKHLTNCRARLVYNPHIVDLLSGHWDGTEAKHELAVKLAELVNSRRET